MSELEAMKKPWDFELDNDNCYIVSNGISDYFCYGTDSAKWLADHLNLLEDVKPPKTEPTPEIFEGTNEALDGLSIRGKS